MMNTILFIILISTFSQTGDITMTHDPDYGSTMTRAESTYGQQVRTYDHRPVGENFAMAKLKEKEDLSISPEGYDCTDTGAGCLEHVTYDGEKPWPDWRDSTSYFMLGKLGFIIDSNRGEQYWRFIKKQNMAESWLKKQRNPYLQQPVMVLIAGGTFVINSIQKPFFNLEKRTCDSCVRFVSLKKAKSKLRKNINLKIKYMEKEGILPKDVKYDTIMFFKQPETWQEETLPKSLESIIDSETKKRYDDFIKKKGPIEMGEQILNQTILQLGEATNEFIQDFLLNPHMLEYAKLIGPSVPEKEEPKAPQIIPEWVRLMYGNYINKEVGVLHASDEWINSGWKAIEKSCPECETWDDWYCGSMGKAYVNKRASKIQCIETDPEDTRIMPNKFLPGDSSLLGMQYTFELRDSTPENFIERQQPDPYGYDIETPENPIIELGKGKGYTSETIDLYYEEMIKMEQDRIRAETMADKWLGVQNEYSDIQTVIDDEKVNDFFTMKDIGQVTPEKEKEIKTEIRSSIIYRRRESPTPENIN